MKYFDRYLFLFDRDGHTEVNSHWCLTTDLIGDELDKHVQRLLTSNPDVSEVWVIPYLTEAMVKMKQYKLEDFIKEKGRRIPV